MFSLRVRVGAVAGAVLLTMVFVLPASAAMAGTSVSVRSGNHVSSASVRPDTDSGCNPDPVAEATACAAVIGAGLHIDTLRGWAISNVDVTIKDIHIELYGPKGHIKNCPEANLPGFGTTATCAWDPNDTRAAGDYCSRLWQLQSSGFVALSTECIGVHS